MDILIYIAAWFGVGLAMVAVVEFFDPSDQITVGDLYAIIFFVTLGPLGAVLFLVYLLGTNWPSTSKVIWRRKKPSQEQGNE
jgi:hypothetical protein